jgi:hypothetical protein
MGGDTIVKPVEVRLLMRPSDWLKTRTQPAPFFFGRITSGTP